MVLSPGIEPGS